MNTAQRAVIVEVLQAARKLLSETDGTYFICNALQATLRTAPPKSRAAYGAVVYKVQVWVEQAIAPNATYSGWVKVNHPKLWERAIAKLEFGERAREGRLAWMDWMIQHPEIFK